MRLDKLARLNITAWIGARSRASLGSATVGGFAAVVLLRQFTLPGRQIAVLFLVPISFATWFLSPLVGWLLVAAATAVLLLFDLAHANALPPHFFYWDAVVNLGMFAFFAFIFTEVRALYLRERELSLHDPLTGLLNRRAFTNALALETLRMQRHRLPTTVAFIDLDDFKHVNDRFGHAGGDTLLKALATAMKSSVRATDFVARLGGDEFAILLAETDAEAARAVIGKLRDKLAATALGVGTPIAASIGAATFESPSKSPDEMIRTADEIMYGVKVAGKNAVNYRVIA
jgi:diguanylate cyclase (GGDEF)-like protein